MKIATRAFPFFAAVALLALAVGVWPRAASRAQDERVDVRGIIAAVIPAERGDEAAGVLGRILVEGQKEEDTNYEHALVSVTNKTQILTFTGREPGTFADLQVGRRVEVRFVGPVLVTHPVEGTAGTALLLEDTK